MASGLIFIGLGLSGVNSITIGAMQALKKCDKIYAEFYTSFLMDTEPEYLEAIIGKKINILSRSQVEEHNDIIKDAMDMVVGFITAGDTMMATTHVDLRIQAAELGIAVEVHYGISIFSACPVSLGLQPYKFGRTVTLPFSDGDYYPRSPYDNILDNKKRGLHTMILLDISADKHKCMTAYQAIEWLLSGEKRWGKGLINNDTLLCVASKVGSSNERLVAGYINNLLNMDLGEPLQTIVLPGDLHFMEAFALVKFANAPSDIIKD